MDTPEHALQFVNLVRTLQPACLINGRVGSYGEELLGDYQDLNDNGMPTGGLEEYWETPQTLNTTWGYSQFDQQWKSPGNVIQRLVEIVSKGGNYLLNIGPMADGTVPAPSVKTLDRKSTRLNSSHLGISYAVFCLKKKQTVRCACWRCCRTGRHSRPSALAPPPPPPPVRGPPRSHARRARRPRRPFAFFFFKQAAAPGHFPSSPPRRFPD